MRVCLKIHHYKGKCQYNKKLTANKAFIFSGSLLYRIFCDEDIANQIYHPMGQKYMGIKIYMFTANFIFSNPSIQ